MATIKKLTPAILKRIISEEKTKINKQINEAKKTKTDDSVESDIARIKKIQKEQALIMKKFKLLREVRKLLKRRINKKI